MKKEEVGHNFLARLGKTRLRPGGKVATDWLIANGDFNKEKKVRYKLSFYGFDRSKFLKINSYRKKNNNEINYNNIADYHRSTNEDRESFYKDWRKE